MSKAYEAARREACDPANWRVMQEHRKFTEYCTLLNMYIRQYRNGKFMYQNANTNETGWAEGKTNPEMKREVWHRLEVDSFRDAVKAVMVIERMEQT